MPRPHRCLPLLCLLLIACVTPASASAYKARPKLVVVIVIDQLRADLLERNRTSFGTGGFRLLMERGAYFTDCHYEYSNLHTSPGHASVATGTYTSGHGILGNEWYDPRKKKVVGAVEDDSVQIVGVANGGIGYSAKNLLSSSLGDELRMATGGKSRVFTLSFKERAAILSAGHGGSPFWLDRASGTWVSSTAYMAELPKWAADFNAAKKAEKYWDIEWKDAAGKVIDNTQRMKDGKPRSFYHTIGMTPFANDYQLEFARELVTQEKLGSGPTTDLLVISLSAQDIRGHEVGPDDPSMDLMLRATDRQLEEFFQFIGRQVGLANAWITLTGDHGIPPMPAYANKMKVPADNFDMRQLAAAMNKELNAMLSPGKNAVYIPAIKWSVVFLSEEAFTAANIKEADAERIAGEVLVKLSGSPGFYGKSALAEGRAPNDKIGLRYQRSHSPHGGWWVMARSKAFAVGYPALTDHGTAYAYDAHVPLMFYGLPFQPGHYRGRAEPIDMAVTLASLLGVNRPSAATGRVLTEILPTPAADARANSTTAPEKTR